MALAQRAVELFNRDFSEEGFVEGKPPDETRALYVEEPVIVPIRAALEGIEYNGPTTLEDFAAAIRESWTWLRIEIASRRALDDELVLVNGTLTGSGRESGAETSAAVTWLIEIEGDRVAAVRTFTSEQAALEAAAR